MLFALVVCRAKACIETLVAETQLVYVKVLNIKLPSLACDIVVVAEFYNILAVPLLLNIKWLVVRVFTFVRESILVEFNLLAIYCDTDKAGRIIAIENE